jgi:hypothetical protein
VYANGHDYVARQLKKKGNAFVQVDNAFVELDDRVPSRPSLELCGFFELSGAADPITCRFYGRRLRSAS